VRFWKGKPDLEQLSGHALLDRAHSVGIRITDISGGTGHLAEILALAQFGEERIRQQIREKEKELSEQSTKKLKTAQTIVAIVGGVLAAVATLLAIYKALS